MKTLLLSFITVLSLLGSFTPVQASIPDQSENQTAKGGNSPFPQKPKPAP